MAYYSQQPQHDQYDQYDLAEGAYNNAAEQGAIRRVRSPLPQPPLLNPYSHHQNPEHDQQQQAGRHQLTGSFSEPAIGGSYPAPAPHFPNSHSTYDYAHSGSNIGGYTSPLGVDSSNQLRPPYDHAYSNTSDQTLDQGSSQNGHPDLNGSQLEPQQTYDSHYPLNDGQDIDDIPLMQRSSNNGPVHLPGGFVDPAYPPEDVSMVRYGKIPSRQPRRFKTLKRVELYHGNLVLDCPVPSKLLQMCEHKDGREFTHMRYTAATCDPNDFESERYTLRQIFYDPPRSTELFIVLTMYNEDEVLFCRSMQGVLKNIAHLVKRDRSKTWGKDGWKKVVVCIVSDGRSKINSRTLAVLAAMGIYQEGVCKDKVNGKGVAAHIFEFTTQIAIDAGLKASASPVPVQIIFCLKQNNQKKINSHRWFFNAFGPILRPNVCVLLDVGTQPGPTSIYRLWKAFDLNSNIAGACGEIVALKGKYFENLINPLVAAQNFEYKMSNILDKPTESVMGFISVLPGAFSAYRYIALQNDVKGHGPLSEYFKGETLHTNPNTDLWTKNMYLAEDRILCWELVSKRNSSWLLHYVKNAYAITDVPDRVSLGVLYWFWRIFKENDQLPELISQRRRWLNGSFFAAIHSTVHFGYIYRSSHSFTRKLILHFELAYIIYNMIFAWFGLANWYITFTILTRSLSDPSFGLPWAKYVNEVLHYFYIALLVMCFLLAMGNRPQGSNKTFTTAVVFFALITCYMTGIAIFIAVRGIQSVEREAAADGKVTASDFFGDATFRTIVVSLSATYGLYTLASLLFFDPWHMVTSFLQYILLAPSYTNIINVYAFCNVHDVSWGTKGDNTLAPENHIKSDKNNQVEVNVPQEGKEVDDLYEEAWDVLKQKPPKAKAIVDPATKAEDSYKNIRTNVVMLWAIMNGALVAAIVSTSAGANIVTEDNQGGRAANYLTFLLWSVAGLAAVRAIGAGVYLVGFLFTG